MAASAEAHDANALVRAAREGDSAEIGDLLKRGVQIDSTDAAGKTALHIAAEQGNENICQQLVEAGAYIDKVDEEGCTADQLADRYGHSRLAKWLRKEQLFRYGTMKPQTFILRIGGPPGAGKSTVANSLATGTLRGLFRLESQADEGDENPHQRTRAIRIVDFTENKAINGLIIDLGGQGLYFMTHQALNSADGAPVINAIVVSSLRELEQLQLDASQWAGFFACQVRPGSSLQPLLMFATRADRATSHQKATVKSVFDMIRTDYSSYFTFPCQPFFMDARKSRGVGIVQLRTELRNMQQEVLNTAALQPTVCELLQEVLPFINQVTSKPLIKKTDFLLHMGTVLRKRKMTWRDYSADTILSSLKMEVLDLSLDHLTKQGKVLAFKKVALRDLVVIKPDWIYTRLVGLIMSEHPLPKPYVKFVNGYAKLSDVIELLKTAHPDVSGKEAVEILSELGFMIVVDDKALVPVKLEERRSERHWPKIPKAIIVKVVFAGRRYCSVKVVGPFSILFPFTQSHFYHLFNKEHDTELPLWAGGIRIASALYPGAEAIIEAQPKLCCIDIIVRGQIEFAFECHRLLHNICDEVMALVRQLSPGCTVECLILSSEELAVLSESGSLSAPKVAYTEALVRCALEASEHITDGMGSSPEDPRRLMISNDERKRMFLVVGESELLPDNAFDGEVRARDIRMLPCQVIHSKMENDGAELHLGRVSARYSAGALPVNTNICMMVRPVKQGYCYDNVSFSPQVIVGPHLDSRLVKPLTITFPLEVRGNVTALVSKTAAEDTPRWQMIPESCVNVFRDKGCVEVKTYELCRYQVQSGDCLINVLSDYVYFSVSAKLQETTHQLRLLCSGNEDVCKNARGDFQLCHNADDVLKVEAVDGDEICLSVVSEDKSIIQTTSPFVDERLSCVLDEQLSIWIQEKHPSSQSLKGWLFPIWSFLGLSKKPEKTGRAEKDFSWLFTLPKGYGEGYLKAFSVHLSKVDGHLRGSSSVLTFKLSYPGGCQQSPASRAVRHHKQEECITEKEDCTYPSASAAIAEKMTTPQSEDVATRLSRQPVVEQPLAQHNMVEEASKTSATAVTVSECKEIPVDALLDLAGQMSTRVECTKLAGKLGFDTKAILKFNRSEEQVEAIAQTILLTWSAKTSGTRKATKSVLRGALFGIDRPDLANFFKERCKEQMAKNMV